MSSDALLIFLGIDATTAYATIDDVSAKAKEVVSQWMQARIKVIREISQTMGTINRMIGTFRQALSLVGVTIDPFFSALMNMVTSTVSMMISIAAALSATIVGIPAAMIIAAIAIGLNIAMTAKIVRDKAESQRYMRESITRTWEIQQYLSQWTPFGVRF